MDDVLLKPVKKREYLFEKVDAHLERVKRLYPTGSNGAVL